MEHRQAKGEEIESMSSSSSPDQSLASFAREFENFQSMKGTLNSAYQTTKSCFEKIANTQTDDKKGELSKSLLSNEDNMSISRVTNKDATILILGQTNCGKSSLANELLGGGILPTSEVPCTSRIVTLQYSKEGYIRIVGRKNEEMERVSLGSKKRIAKDFVVVPDEAREKLEAVQTTVEVGLDNALLKSGVKLVDAPGLSENDALNKVVQECVGGVLQLIIYVIDGNYGIRLEDQRILGSLYDVAPDLSIFYVCNKIEFHKVANEMDRPSDSESEEEDVDTEQYSYEKKARVFRALVEHGFINRKEKMESCRNFHAISTREIRKLRTGRTVNSKVTHQYLDGFHRMKEDFLYFAGKMLRGHILNATNRLHQAQKHCFDFFVADVLMTGMIKSTKAADVQNMIARLKGEQQNLLKNFEELLAKERTGITESIETAIENVKGDILETVRNMKYTPIKVGESVSKNEMTEQLQQQVQRLVVMRVTQSVKEAINPLIDSVMTSMTQEANKVLNSCSVGSDAVMPELQNVISNITFAVSAPTLSKLMNSENLTWSVAQNWLTYRYKLFSKKVGTSFSGTRVDAEWRESVAMDTLKLLTPQDMTVVVCKEIGDRIQQFCQNLDQNLERIRSLNEISKRQERRSKEAAKTISLDLCGSTCQIEALKNRITYGEIVPTKDDNLRCGTRTDVLDLHPRHRQQWTGTFKEISVRMLKQDDKQQKAKQDELAELIVKSRHLPQDDFILPIIQITDVLLNGEKRMGVVVPKRSSLWDKMKSKRTRVELDKRLLIARGIASACQFMFTHGFPVPDLRITNILLLEDKSKGITPQLNTLKARNDSVLYPDGMPPFHIAPESYGERHIKVPFPIDNDAGNVYAFAILLWMLVLGEYRRPDYAKTHNAQLIKQAVHENRRPELPTTEDKCYSKQLEKCWNRLQNFRPTWEDIIKWFDELPRRADSTILHQDLREKATTCTQRLGPKEGQQKVEIAVDVDDGEMKEKPLRMTGNPNDNSRVQVKKTKHDIINPTDIDLAVDSEITDDQNASGKGAVSDRQTNETHTGIGTHSKGVHMKTSVGSDTPQSSHKRPKSNNEPTSHSSHSQRPTESTHHVARKGSPRQDFTGKKTSGATNKPLHSETTANRTAKKKKGKKSPVDRSYMYVVHDEPSEQPTTECKRQEKPEVPCDKRETYRETDL